MFLERDPKEEDGGSTNNSKTARRKKAMRTPLRKT